MLEIAGSIEPGESRADPQQKLRKENGKRKRAKKTKKTARATGIKKAKKKGRK